MTEKEHAIAKAKAWLQRHKEQLQDQLDHLNDQSHPLKVPPEVIADNEIARSVVRQWIVGIDEVLGDL